MILTWLYSNEYENSGIIRNKLKIQEGKLTSDNGLFSLETVSCLGACGLAPVCMINDKVYPQMTSDAISIVLDTLLKEEGVK